MSEKELLESLRMAVLEGEFELIAALTEKAITRGIPAVQIMNDALSVGIQEAGKLYEEGEYFLPDIVCSADAMKNALEILQPYLDEDAEHFGGKGKIVLATVQGDIHDIGKTIVASMLTSAGFTVYDLGCNVPNEEVVRVAKEKNADIVGLSALLATTMQEQKNIVEAFQKEKSTVRVIIGGAPVTQMFADKIGANGYSENAIEAVQLVSRLLKDAKEV